MTRSIPRDFRTVLLCEDIRQEKNNKHILIGVFSGDVVFASFPASVNFAFYIEYLAPTSGIYNFQLRLKIGKKVAGRLEIKAEIPDPPVVLPIPVPKLGVKFENETEFSLDVSINEGRWKRLMTKQIRQGEVPS